MRSSGRHTFSVGLAALCYFFITLPSLLLATTPTPLLCGLAQQQIARLWPLSEASDVIEALLKSTRVRARLFSDPAAPRDPDRRKLGFSPADAELIAKTIVEKHAQKILEIVKSRPPDPYDGRVYVKLYEDATSTVWGIAWENGQSTLIHDHMDSNVGISVVSGKLEETRWRIEPLRESGVARTRPEDLVIAANPLLRVVSPPAAIRLGHPAVHLVAGAASGVSVSVHVYSPPLKKMRFYRKDGARVVSESHWVEPDETP